MGRKGNQDRGLFERTNPSGEVRWYIRFQWQGRDVKRLGGVTKAQARRTLHHTLADLQRGKASLTHRGDTFAAALERYRPFAETTANYKKSGCFPRFWEGRFGPTPLARITPANIQQGQAALLKAGKAPATVNRYTDWLRHLLNREVRMDHIVSNPVLRITRFKEPPAPVHHYSVDQEQRIMEELGNQGLWVRLAILTGLRQRNQFTIRKDWIKWDQGIIDIPKTKTMPRQVIITTEIADIVRKIIDATPPTSPWLFPSPRNAQRHLDPYAWYRKTFRRACARAGLPAHLKWHTMRHTFGSRLADLNATASQIQELGGWATAQAANRYIHQSQARLREVAEQLSQKPKNRNTKWNIAN